MSALLQLTDVGNRQPYEDAEMYRERVADLLQRKSKTFPGAQPVSFSRRHFKDLQHEEYVPPSVLSFPNAGDNQK